jgi:hypothetical protein
MRSRKLAPALAVVACAGLFSLAPAAAGADTYAPGANAQTFATGAGGWTNTTSMDGLCISPLICPAISNNFVGTGGVGGAGDGYINTALTGVLSTVAATSTGTWESPAFTYNGNSGLVPATATFDLSRLPNISALLGIDVLNDSFFKVDLVNTTNNSVINLVPPISKPLGDNVWAAIPTASVNPALLSLGTKYKIRITTSYHTVVSVLPSGSIGYDNVRISTTGTGANGGSEITSSSQLAQLILSQGLPNSATLRGNKLLLKVKCPKQAAPHSCKYVLRGLAKGKKSKAATGKKKVTIKAGKKKKVKIKVKPRFLAKYQKAKKVFVKAKVQVGTVKATVTKKMKLIHKL